MFRTKCAPFPRKTRFLSLAFRHHLYLVRASSYPWSACNGRTLRGRGSLYARACARKIKMAGAMFAARSPIFPSNMRFVARRLPHDCPLVRQARKGPVVGLVPVSERSAYDSLASIAQFRFWVHSVPRMRSGQNGPSFHGSL